MRNKTNRFLSILLALLLVICLIPATVFADEEATTYEDGTYKANGITSSLSMFKNIIDTNSCKVVIKDGAATLIIVTKNDKRYSEIMLGLYSEKIKTGEEEGIRGFYNDIVNEDGTRGVTFVIPIEDNEAFLSFPEGGSVLNIILRYKVGYVDSNGNDLGRTWYKPSKDATVTVTGIEKESSDTTLPTGNAVDDVILAAAVDEEIAAIGTVTLDSEEAITAARASYDALTDVQKDLVANLETLTAAEEALAALKTAQQDEVDAAAAAAVDEKIAAIGEVTLEKEEAITAARAAYDKLTDAQKKLVSNLATLTAAEEALKALKDSESAAHVDLTITNNTGMFKVVTAYVETAEDGTKTLVFALSGKSYENLFKGTYEEAKANGNDRTKWIKGTTNADGKLEFRLPISDSDTYIPLVSISNSYLAKYEAGENPLERAFYPRQIELDLEAKTLVAGDYEGSKELKITNNVKMFKPSTATLTTIGGPNSNGYKKVLDLTMGSDSFDKAFIGTKDKASSAEIVSIKDKVFTFTLLWMETAGDLDSITDLMAEPIIISFHSVSKDAWYEREAIVSESKGTLTFNDVQAEDDDVVKIVSAKDNASDPVHWTKGDLTEDQKLTKKIAVQVNPDIETEDVIDDIIWQRDITVPEGTEFPVTLEFEIKDAKEGDIYFFYHFNGEKWEVVGKSTDGKATITYDKLSPNAVVKTSNPATGDHSKMFVWGAATVICIAAAVVLIATRRKEEN
ncbi:MAG: hypothetical protein J5535_03770 [Firmicutes bacterium]|nr:hypothetical protein [Bacillota bacterium]